MSEKSLCVRSNFGNFDNDFNDVVRAFEPEIKYDPQSAEYIDVLMKSSSGVAKIDIMLMCFGNFAEHIDSLTIASPVYSDDAFLNDLTVKKQTKRAVKRSIYRFISKRADVMLPYGSLTGIRPLKMYYSLLDEGRDAEKVLRDDYDVSEQKVELLKAIYCSQRGIYGAETDRIDLFLNIPVCPTRCSYCSFISIERSKLSKKIMEKYICDLIEELRIFSETPLKNRIRSVYIGGGTPGVLTAEELERVITPIYDMISGAGIEFTVECGRPETIDDDKLSVLSDLGVSRISINPQSFNQSTLDRIGRTHTVTDVYRAYDMTEKYDFDVNMDLIATLPGETAKDFYYSVDEALRLHPENLTVHSLALKRGSKLYMDNFYDVERNESAVSMIDYANRRATECGYAPYYMYRLKNMSGALENTGYAMPGKACVYNIDIMEETHSVYAIGAGAISKKISANGLLERFADSKDIHYYLDNFDKIVAEKQAFFATLTEE